MPLLHYAVPRQGPDRQHSVPDVVLHVGAAHLHAPGDPQCAVLLCAAVHHHQAERVRRPGVPLVPVRVRRHHAGVPVHQPAGAPLSAAGVSDGAEEQRGQGPAVRDCVRHGALAFVGRQAAVLLLAGVQCESLRSARSAV